MCGNSLQAAQTFVELRDGLDPAKIIFERDVLVRSVRVFVGQTEAQQDARHFECVVHLRDEWDRPALADKYGTLAESLLERAVRHFEKRMRVRRDPRLAAAVHVQLEF